jgi:ribosomal protein S18 acetylase RimI-like enzyme
VNAVRVRSATPADAVAMARVHVDSWREAYASLLPASVLAALSYAERERQWSEWLARSDIDSFVAESEGAILGFSAGGAKRDEGVDVAGELYALYLMARYHGSGTGRALFEAVRTSLRARGLTPFQLFVIAGNPACAFYERLGGRSVLTQAAEVRGAQIVEHVYVFD